jgi:SAM-dependent methyltransferase
MGTSPQDATHMPHQPPPPPKDAWGNGGAYERYVGRWSRQVAAAFVEWLAVPPGGRWLDVGCGTGALIETILGRAAPAEVQGIDRADGFVAFVREQLRDPRVQADVGDAQALPVADARYHAVVSGLMLNFVPQPHAALAEMVRAARPGGIVAVYVWDYAGRMEFMQHFWEAAAVVDPAAAELEEGRRFPICQPQPLQKLFQAAGLSDVAVQPIEIATDFYDFDDYWTPFLGGQGAAPSYLLTLSEERRGALRERLRATLPYAQDGSIRLVARAWAVRGVR